MSSNAPLTNIDAVTILAAKWHLKPAESAQLAEQVQSFPSAAEHLLECDALLGAIYGEALAREWMSLPNSNVLFQGASPLSLMLHEGGAGILKIHRLLYSRAV